MAFHADNDIGQNKVRTGESGKGITLDGNIFSWDGHGFAGWNTGQDGTGDEYTDKQAIALAADMELYAQWVDVPANNDKTVFCAIGPAVGLVVGLLVMALVKRN